MRTWPYNDELGLKYVGVFSDVVAACERTLNVIELTQTIICSTCPPESTPQNCAHERSVSDSSSDSSSVWHSLTKSETPESAGTATGTRSGCLHGGAGGNAGFGNGYTGAGKGGTGCGYRAGGGGLMRLGFGGGGLIGSDSETMTIRTMKKEGNSIRGGAPCLSSEEG